MFKKIPQRCTHVKLSNVRWNSSSIQRQIQENLSLMLTPENQNYVLEDTVVPLYSLPYEKQLLQKEGHIKALLHSLCRNECRLSPFVPSPVLEHYRNKDEYNFRMGIDNDPKTLGLFTGRPVNGVVHAVRPVTIPIIKPKHNRIAQVFEEFTKKSPLPASHDLNDGGYWRRLTLRSNRADETMAIITNYPVKRNAEELAKEKEDIVRHFEENDCHLDSIYFQLCRHVRCDVQNSDITLIHGLPYLYEKLLGCKFRISPDAFFQINVAAAEVLYEEVFRLAKLSKQTTLLDLCCGVGTYSLTASDDVRNCIGIDSNFSAIEDAVRNAEINQIDNCDFVPGAVETALNRVLRSLETVGEMVVIVNPGRNGLNPRAIELILRNNIIHKLIYVSCKPDNRTTMFNFEHLLSGGKKCKDNKFKLTKAVPVDLFPHTAHYELVLLFER